MSRALLVLVLGCGACASSPADPETPPRPDERALAVETLCRARTAKVVLSSRWRGDARLDAAGTTSPGAGRVEARGPAVFTVKKLRLEISERLEITWLDDHEHLLVYARDVEVFKQIKGYGHRTENADAVTLADGEVSIFQQS